ncbi:MAG: hypothetical protein ACXIUB_00875 [Wenzhouxiangella sp.]
MTYIYSALKYLAIGFCLGIGIILADQLYLKHGSPHQIAVMEEILEELYESHADLFDFAGMSGFPEYSFTVFRSRVNFEEPCITHLRAENPSFRCEDDPHSTAGRISTAEVLDERIENIERIAVDGTFVDEMTEGFRVVRWFTDIEKLSSVLEESRTEPRPESRGTSFQMPDRPLRFSALVCDDKMCFTLSSASRTKVEGILVQIIEQ